MIIYNRIVNLSDTQVLKFSKGKKMFEADFPTLSALPFVYENMLPNLTTIEKEILIRKIQKIHNTRQKIVTG